MLFTPLSNRFCIAQTTFRLNATSSGLVLTKLFLWEFFRTHPTCFRSRNRAHGHDFVTDFFDKAVYMCRQQTLSFFPFGNQRCTTPTALCNPLLCKFSLSTQPPKVGAVKGCSGLVDYRQLALGGRSLVGGVYWFHTNRGFRSLLGVSQTPTLKNSVKSQKGQP